jgi:hypothetical protein
VALENLDVSLDVNSTRESIRENFKISTKQNLGYHRLYHNKPWLDEDRSKLMDQRKQAK